MGRPASFRGFWISVRRLTKCVLNSIQDLDDSRRASIRLNTQRRSASACYTVILNLIQDPCFEKETPVCLFGIVLSYCRVQCRASCFRKNAIYLDSDWLSYFFAKVNFVSDPHKW